MDDTQNTAGKTSTNTFQIQTLPNLKRITSKVIDFLTIFPIFLSVFLFFHRAPVVFPAPRCSEERPAGAPRGRALRGGGEAGGGARELGGGAEAKAGGGRHGGVVWFGGLKNICFLFFLRIRWVFFLFEFFFRFGLFSERVSLRVRFFSDLQIFSKQFQIFAKR